MPTPRNLNRRVTTAPNVRINPISKRVESQFNGNNYGIPEHPGQQRGKDLKQARQFTANMVKRKGFRFSGGTSAVANQLKISGTANFLLGITFLGVSFGVCTLMLNDEQVFENVDTGFFQFGSTEQDYYALNRDLSGQDDITLTITGDAPYVNRSFVIYYL